ncbi:MAG: SIMPL domain-containing protein [Patescibacteria group bacterium]
MEDTKFDLSNRFFIITAILVLGVLVYFAGQMAYQFTSLDRQNMNQITVSGEGKVYAKPDIAIVSLGVTTQGNTTAEVIKSNTDKMNAVIQAVKDSGVDEKDITSTTYNLSPLYNYTEAAGRVFQGYTLDQNIEVKIRDFAKIGDILSKATAKGANLANNLQFTIDNPEQFKQEARAKAIEQAKANAQNLVKESGIKLGKLINVYENYIYPGVYNSKATGLGGGIAESEPVPTIQPGQQEINITINLTYQVR